MDGFGPSLNERWTNLLARIKERLKPKYYQPGTVLAKQPFSLEQPKKLLHLLFI